MESTARDLPLSQDYDVVPGTVYIIEQPSILNGDSKAEIILIPTPADDLDDPLRWSSWRKRYHLFLLVIYSTLMTALGNWEASIYLNITEALGTSVTLMNIGAALTLLMLGIGNVFFTPLSHSEFPSTSSIWNPQLTTCRVWSQVHLLIKPDPRHRQSNLAC